MRFLNCLLSLKKNLLCIGVLTGIICSTYSYGQQNKTAAISELISSVQQTVEKYPVEKLYLHLDKPWYYSGDTLWFKAYLFDAAYLSASIKSGMMYVEISDDTNRLVKRMSIPVNFGLSWGNVSLDSKLPPGAYVLKAYTSWMLNFGETQIFKKRFYVNDVSVKPWLITLKSDISNSGEKQFSEINLGIKNSKNQPVSSNPFQLRMLEAGKTIERSSFVSDVNGNIAFRFPLPQRSLRGDLTVTLENRQKDATGGKFYVPVLIDRPEYTDLQFLPESGALVAGITSRVGIKNIGENGLGKNVSGLIVNQAGEKITEFATTNRGIGAFEFTPQPDQRYRALMNTSMGQKSWPLPAIQASGTVMRITNDVHSDSIVVDIFCSNDIAQQSPQVMLVAQARNLPCWGAGIGLKKSPAHIKIDKKYFPDGVIKFTLLSADKVPLNERLIFIRRKQDELTFKIDFNKDFYTIRDSISAGITVLNREGNPVQTGLSVAVTDNSQVTPESSSDLSIVSAMLLSSEIKGNIEEPGYYFSDDSSGTVAANLDNLMLTQGWRGFDWNTLLKKSPEIKYEAESFFGVKGRVLNLFNKPVKNTSVVLFSRTPVLFMDTKTNDSGVFVFPDLPPSDTASFLIQARNARGKSFNVGIEVNEFKPPVISGIPIQKLPWYVNIDTARYAALTRSSRILETKAEITGKSQTLEEVFVIGKKVIRDSKNLNGPGESDFAMNAAELEKAGKISLGKLIGTNIEGFHIGGKSERVYMVNSMVFHLVIDGMVVDRFLPEGMSMFDYYNTFLNFYSAEDIKGVELMKTGRYQMSYTREYIPDPLARFYEHAFIEVTTFAGHGPFLKKIPGVYLYKPLPLTSPLKFYSPKYSADSSLNALMGTDTRSTIHWEPNLITDINGKAKLSFYAADYPGTYTIVIEGSNMDGLIGNSRKTITVK